MGAADWPFMACPELVVLRARAREHTPRGVAGLQAHHDVVVVRGGLFPANVWALAVGTQVKGAFPDDDFARGASRRGPS